MRRLTASALAVCAVLALAGCSQVQALAPVGGNAITEVRYAANDVLVAAHVAIRTAPVCRATETAVTCEGTTTSGQRIHVATTTSDLGTIRVSVGSKILYSGPVQRLLDAGARPSA